MAVFHEMLYEAAGCVFAASALRKWSEVNARMGMSVRCQAKVVVYDSAELKNSLSQNWIYDLSRIQEIFFVLRSILLQCWSDIGQEKSCISDTWLISVLKANYSDFLLTMLLKMLD